MTSTYLDIFKATFATSHLAMLFEYTVSHRINVCLVSILRVLTCFPNVSSSKNQQFDLADVVVIIISISIIIVVVAAAAVAESNDPCIVQATNSLRCHIVLYTPCVLTAVDRVFYDTHGSVCNVYSVWRHLPSCCASLKTFSPMRGIRRLMANGMLCYAYPQRVTSAGLLCKQ